MMCLFFTNIEYENTEIDIFWYVGCYIDKVINFEFN